METETKKQPGPIRVGGIATLAISVGVLSAAGYFLAAPFAKSLISTGMEQAFGAETNIDSVDINWQPFGLAVNGLKQTNPDKLDENLFEFNQASASVNLLELMIGNVLIEDLTVDNLMFNTQRLEKGEVIESDEANEETSTEAESELGGGIEVPSADELLAKADLITEKKAKALKQTWDHENKQLKAKVNALPSKDALKKYEAQWKEIENTKIKSLEDLENLKKKVKALKAKLKKDKSAISELKSQYKESKANVDLAYKELKAAPDQDWKNIKSKLPIDDPNAVAISKLIFGDEVTGYIVKAEELYQTIKPFIDANKEVKAQDKLSAEKLESGRDIKFELEEKWPAWVIKQLLINVVAPNQQRYKITGEEINVENYVRNNPSRYGVTLDSEIKGESLMLSGKYFVDTAGEIVTDGNWDAKGINVDSKSLTDSSDLQVQMQDAVLSGSGRYDIGNQLDSQNTISFSNVNLTGNASTKLAQLTLDTLTKVSKFNLNVGLKGVISSPDVSIKSDLDNQLNTAFKEQVSDRWNELQDETKGKLKDKLQAELNLNAKDLQKFNKIKEQYENADSDLKKYGQEQLDKLVNDKKSELEEKAKDKLKDKLKNKLKDFGF